KCTTGAPFLNAGISSICRKSRLRYWFSASRNCWSVNTPGVKSFDWSPARLHASLLILEIADQDHIITRGAARKRELFSVPRPGKTENSIGLEVHQLFGRPTIDCLGPDGRTVSFVHVGQRAPVWRPASMEPGN